MPISFSSNSEAGLLAKTGPRVQQFPTIARRQSKKIPFNRLAIIAFLILFVSGCVNVAPAAQQEVPEEASQSVSAGPGDTYLPLTGAETDQQAIVAPAIPKLYYPLEGAPTATPSGLAELSFIPEPTSIIVPATGAIPTSTPPPTPAPTGLPTATPVLSSTVESQPEIKYVVIISVDGMGPEGMETAETPTLDRLRARGAYSGQAQTVPQSVTLISHASMLTGMTPEKHGLQSGLPYIGWPGLDGPSLCSVAHEAGFTTAMVFGKEKLNYLVLPNSVDELFGTNTHDPEIKEQAVEMIEAGMPNVLFIHFPDVDRVGHAYGWISENQLFAINFVDGLIDEIVAALESGGYLQNTLLIITADHGGHGFRHGDDCPEDRTIPWLAVGPGVPSGVTLSSPINTFDTAATALYALGLPIPENWDGRPVLEIFQ
jgi:hypothetical protein